MVARVFRLWSSTVQQRPKPKRSTHTQAKQAPFGWIPRMESFNILLLLLVALASLGIAELEVDNRVSSVASVTSQIETVVIYERKAKTVTSTLQAKLTKFTTTGSKKSTQTTKPSPSRASGSKSTKTTKPLPPGTTVSSTVSLRNPKAPSKTKITTPTPTRVSTASTIGMGTRGIIGIAVGAFVALVLLLASSWFCARKWRSSTRPRRCESST
ncbi:hypothetical protein BKA65DRAFT_484669 [Rhexocercosporidium sp. MPI-PUGE-AT-0058]|nr:hypothetical protein BKA65DRAFT_484669 [Rhexocercosporidium sp. MPI-PUGE-AT-0058]